jgi:hypothetical protein
MNFNFVKASELKVRDLVHQSTGMHKIVKVERGRDKDDWLRIEMSWLKYPDNIQGGMYHPESEFLRQSGQD